MSSRRSGGLDEEGPKLGDEQESSWNGKARTLGVVVGAAVTMVVAGYGALQTFIAKPSNGNGHSALEPRVRVLEAEVAAIRAELLSLRSLAAERERRFDKIEARMDDVVLRQRNGDGRHR